MKKYSTFNEALCATADKNPGNSLSCGISNHYTPVENIVTNIKNLFCAMLGVVAAVGEDGVSVKLHSTQFTSEKNVYDRLYNIMYNSQSLYSYITQQGLTACKLVNVGQYFVVYFSPVDLANATAANDAAAKELAKCCDGCAPCSEMLDMNIEEAELSTINESNDEDEEELEKIRAKEVTTVLKMKDKVKAAKELGIMVSQQISLPSEYYFSGVKSKDGDESIALRWKYIKRRPHGKSTELTKSLLNIFGVGKEAVWVGDFDKDSMFELPEEVKKLIENILEFIGAEKTSDPCVYKIDSEDEKKEEKDKKEKEEKEKKAEEDDKTEDDKSRGDDSDDLLGDDSKDDKKDDDPLL